MSNRKKNGKATWQSLYTYIGVRVWIFQLVDCKICTFCIYVFSIYHRLEWFLNLSRVIFTQYSVTFNYFSLKILCTLKCDLEIRKSGINYFTVKIEVLKGYVRSHCRENIILTHPARCSLKPLSGYSVDNYCFNRNAV